MNQGVDAGPVSQYKVAPTLGWPHRVVVDARIGWPDVPRETLSWTTDALTMVTPVEPVAEGEGPNPAAPSIIAAGDLEENTDDTSRKKPDASSSGGGQAQGTHGSVDAATGLDKLDRRDPTAAATGLDELGRSAPASVEPVETTQSDRRDPIAAATGRDEPGRSAPASVEPVETTQSDRRDPTEATTGVDEPGRSAPASVEPVETTQSDRRDPIAAATGRDEPGRSAPVSVESVETTQSDGRGQTEVATGLPASVEPVETTRFDGRDPIAAATGLDEPGRPTPASVEPVEAIRFDRRDQTAAAPGLDEPERSMPVSVESVGTSQSDRRDPTEATIGLDEPGRPTPASVEPVETIRFDRRDQTATATGPDDFERSAPALVEPVETTQYDGRDQTAAATGLDEPGGSAPVSVESVGTSRSDGRDPTEAASGLDKLGRSAPAPVEPVETSRVDGRGQTEAATGLDKLDRRDQTATATGLDKLDRRDTTATAAGLDESGRSARTSVEPGGSDRAAAATGLDKLDRRDQTATATGTDKLDRRDQTAAATGLGEPERSMPASVEPVETTRSDRRDPPSATQARDRTSEEGYRQTVPPRRAKFVEEEFPPLSPTVANPNPATVSRETRQALPRPASTRIFVVANQKGGVGKTTTSVNLAAALALGGLAVLVIDLDPQGNASTALGVDHQQGVAGTYEVLIGGQPIADHVVNSPEAPRLTVLPATIDLAAAEIELVSTVARESRLLKALKLYLRDNQVDYVFFDCPPSLGLLTLNALVAANEILIPIQCEYYALEGVSQLMRTIDLVKGELNDELELSTVLLTMFDARTRLAAQVADEVRAHFAAETLPAVIPRSVRISEAPSYGQSVLTYHPDSAGAVSYLEAAKEIARRGTEEPS